jgi:ubiquinone/menaquinone biosynthesis C-methylase UbiE
MGNPSTPAPPAHQYVLGHIAHRVDRLKAQTRLIDPIAERYFGAAGICSGMRMLDVGSDAGDVTFLASDIVRAGGAVVGVDRVAAVVRVAWP